MVSRVVTLFIAIIVVNMIVVLQYGGVAEGINTPTRKSCKYIVSWDPNQDLNQIKRTSHTKGCETNKEIYVGDKLRFIYSVNRHNVFDVNETNYKACYKACTTSKQDPLNYNVDFELTGKKTYYFICNFPDQCKSGMKMQIDVKGH